jgi:hypothetical protein
VRQQFLCKAAANFPAAEKNDKFPFDKKIFFRRNGNIENIKMCSLHEVW